MSISQCMFPSVIVFPGTVPFVVPGHAASSTRTSFPRPLQQGDAEIDLLRESPSKRLRATNNVDDADADGSPEVGQVEGGVAEDVDGSAWSVDTLEAGWPFVAI
eukprot:4574401-Amphidinium_carterae.2